MSALTNKDVGRIVKEATEKFLNQPTCMADKRNMLTLVQKLERYTNEVQEAADEHGIASDHNVQQWAKDMENWRVRLSLYYQALEGAQYETGPESCEELRTRVIEPLLVGWYPDDYPGIVNPDVQTVPDVAMPYILGNQVVVYRDHQQHRTDRLICDLTLCDAQAVQEMGDYWADTFGLNGKSATCKVLKPTKDDGLLCWVKRIGIGAATVGGVYLVYRGVKAKKKRDAAKAKEAVDADRVMHQKLETAAAAEGMAI